MWNYMYTLSCIGEKKAKLKELSNNISDRSEAKGTGIMTDLLLNERSEVSGKSALYYIIPSTEIDLKIPYHEVLLTWKD